MIDRAFLSLAGVMQRSDQAVLLALHHRPSLPSRLPSDILGRGSALQLRDSAGLSPASLLSAARTSSANDVINKVLV